MHPVSLEFDGTHFVLRGGSPAGHDQVHSVVSSWPGWKRSGGGSRWKGELVSTYRAPAYASCVAPLHATQVLDIEWTKAAWEKSTDLLSKLTGIRAMLAEKMNVPFNPPTERIPLQHQRQAVCVSAFMDHRCLLADDMGLGKTSTALWCVHLSKASRLLVICPVSVKFNWKREVETTIGDDWATYVVNGTPRQRAKLMADAFETAAGSKTCIVINYDLLQHLAEKQLVKLGDFAAGQFLIVDESHYLKNRKSARTQLVTATANSARHVMLLSGTPVRNLVDDLFSQVDIIHPGTWTSYFDFGNRHLVVQSVEFGKKVVQKVVAAKNLDALNAVMNTLQIRRKKEDVLELPPKTYTYPQLELDEVTVKVYTAMKKFARLALEQMLQEHGNLNIFSPQASSAVEAAMRCEQIAQGFVGGIPEPVMLTLSDSVLKHAHKIPGRPNELLFPKAPKLLWLVEAIESIVKQGGNPIVFARFNAPLLWLSMAWQLEGQPQPLILHGALNAKQKDEVVSKFQAEGGVLLCQVKMAEGFNATRSQDVLFLGRDWSPAINRQAEDRCHRIGQKGTVNVQIPVVLDTIEVAIHARLIDKESDAEQALRNVTLEELMEAL